MHPSKLTTKRQKFVDAYVSIGKWEASCDRGQYGPKTAESQASKLLRKENVKSYLLALLETSTTQSVMKKEQILVNLSNIARANLIHVARWSASEVELIDSSILDEQKVAGIQALAKLIPRKRPHSNLLK